VAECSESELEAAVEASDADDDDDEASFDEEEESWWWLLLLLCCWLWCVLAWISV